VREVVKLDEKRRNIKYKKCNKIQEQKMSLERFRLISALADAMVRQRCAAYVQDGDDDDDDNDDGDGDALFQEL
jgi:hypothetical protein